MRLCRGSLPASGSRSSRRAARSCARRGCTRVRGPARRAGHGPSGSRPALPASRSAAGRASAAVPITTATSMPPRILTRPSGRVRTTRPARPSRKTPVDRRVSRRLRPAAVAWTKREAQSRATPMRGHRHPGDPECSQTSLEVVIRQWDPAGASQRRRRRGDVGGVLLIVAILAGTRSPARAVIRWH